MMKGVTWILVLFLFEYLWPPPVIAQAAPKQIGVVRSSACVAKFRIVVSVLAALIQNEQILSRALARTKDIDLSDESRMSLTTVHIQDDVRESVLRLTATSKSAAALGNDRYSADLLEALNAQIKVQERIQNALNELAENINIQIMVLDVPRNIGPVSQGRSIFLMPPSDHTSARQFVSAVRAQSLVGIHRSILDLSKADELVNERVRMLLTQCAH